VSLDIHKKPKGELAGYSGIRKKGNLQSLRRQKDKYNSPDE
jgi:hypothetical protein